MLYFCTKGVKLLHGRNHVKVHATVIFSGVGGFVQKLGDPESSSQAWFNGSYLTALLYLLTCLFFMFIANRANVSTPQTGQIAEIEQWHNTICMKHPIERHFKCNA